MIEVKARSDCIIISGHAGYAEAGKDIVCAGVTALVQTLVKSMDCFTEDRPQYQVDPGLFYIEIENLSESAKLLIDSFFIGLCSIAEEFPDHIRIA